MRNVGRDVDEISGAGFINELKIVSPAKASAAADDVNHGFELSVMMRAGLGIGMNYDGSRPEFLCADAGAGNGFGAGHAGGLRRVGVEFAAADDAQAVSFPVESF